MLMQLAVQIGFQYTQAFRSLGHVTMRLMDSSAQKFPLECRLGLIQIVAFQSFPEAIPSSGTSPEFDVIGGDGVVSSRTLAA